MNLSLKDTVTILKFLWIFEFFSKRRFCRDNVQNINSICLVNNYWVRSLLFWGQTRWVIPMTSFIVVSKDLVKNSKKWKSQNSMNKSKFRLRICFYIMNTSNNIFFDSPKPYRKVRKFTMDGNWRKMEISRLGRGKILLFRSKYYLFNCVERQIAFEAFSSHVTMLFDQKKTF